MNAADTPAAAPEAPTTAAALRGMAFGGVRPTEYRGQGTGCTSGQAIKKVNYSHDALIDAILSRPNSTQRELAAIFDYTEGWISRVISSDAFQARLAARKEEIIDPLLKADIEACFKGLVTSSLNKLMNLIEADRIEPGDMIKAVDVGARVLGYGARSAQVQVNNTQFVVQVPGKAVSSEQWQAAYQVPTGVPVVIEAGGDNEEG